MCIFMLNVCLITIHTDIYIRHWIQGISRQKVMCIALASYCLRFSLEEEQLTNTSHVVNKTWSTGPDLSYTIKREYSALWIPALRVTIQWKERIGLQILPLDVLITMQRWGLRWEKLLTSLNRWWIWETEQSMLVLCQYRSSMWTDPSCKAIWPDGFTLGLIIIISFVEMQI